jgi:superfamily II RNA helicase
VTEAKPEGGPRLGELVFASGADDGEAILDRFLAWAKGAGLELYPAQEEAILELIAGKHVILNTPTGSGKSLVALAMHFKGLCQGRRSFYTSPIKALVSEKFFALCRELGADRVGMLTGDASINPKAPVICCTAEILANMALREGRYLAVDDVIMDEFHYYADPDRGMAWQVPLLLLNDAVFMLMSATLGDMTPLADDLKARTEREVAIVKSRDRPVPLDYEYRETQLFRTIQDLVAQGRSPIYLVNFTQRDAAEEAQNLTSVDITAKEEKQAIVAAIKGFRFDTPFGKEVKRFVRQGIGLHHAGLLPKYRLLVEQLSQRGLLKVISGTDTLGVGVNIPIRTVLFTKLCKYDGTKVRLLSVREFQQLGGRAGRRGFDTRGSVVCQAPEHIVDNKAIDAKIAGSPNKKLKLVRKKPPEKGFVHYDAAVFKRLIESEPEPLRSQFEVTHGLLMNMLTRELKHGEPHAGFRRVVELIDACHESSAGKARLRRHAASLFRGLRSAGVVSLVRPEWDPRPYVQVKPDLQREFSLHQTLSLYLLDALPLVDLESPGHALSILSLVEAILENPRALLERQEDKLKGDKLLELKAAGVEYNERMAELEKVTYLQPNAEFIYATFDQFRASRPWVAQENVRPKSIARDMYESYASFNDYVREYGLQRSEGLLLRYVSETYKALLQIVPESYRTDEVLEILAYLRTLLAHVDTSLIEEWEAMLSAAEEGETVLPGKAPRPDISKDPKAFRARIRAEVHSLVKALAAKNFEDAAAAIWQPGSGDEEQAAWSEERLAQALAPFFAEHERVLFNERARFSEMTIVKPAGERRYTVVQRLADQKGEDLWAIEADIDLSDPAAADGPLLRLRRIGT